MINDSRYQNQLLLTKLWRRRYSIVALWKIVTAFLQPGFWRLYRQDSEDCGRPGFWYSFMVYRSVCWSISHNRMNWTYSKAEMQKYLREA